ncbi:26S proteasome subunit alpha-4 [Tubulinosema ratisbonensis]|uniref:Proteasome subunit alpha type n=1 Tax=Tubulinosema ratisbonensis TaxID=291195 RepID=A0A437ALK6_9MICR|nr:26S proteasome subunit alpha-4 [Tubulinosema ratisbonensis]
MSYTESLNVFSPDGRLIQVEYAHHASDQGSLIIAKTSIDSILLCIEKKSTSKNVLETSKLFKVCDDVYFSYSGLAADAQIIFTKLVLFYHNYKISTDTYPDISALAMELGNIKFKYTIQGGKRPFGARSILMGFEEGPKIFIVEPDGNYGEYKQAALGYKNDKVEFIDKNVTNQQITVLEDEKLLSLNLEEQVFKDLTIVGRAMNESIKIDYRNIESFIIYQSNIYKVHEDSLKEIIEKN